MQIDSVDQIPQIVNSTGFSIFVFPRDYDFNEINTKKSIVIEPEKKSNDIKIDQIREIFSLLGTKQERDLTIIVRPAESLNEASSNAFLKNLEEPKENVHIVFFTHDITQLLPTIRSRANIYTIKSHLNFNEAPKANTKDLELAKSLLIANDKQLISLSEKLAKSKKSPRQRTLKILDLCIELAYKSFFKTSDKKWLKKLNKLTKAYENIKANGHIRLQLVAQLMGD